jgi:hypothetical protein
MEFQNFEKRENKNKRVFIKEMSFESLPLIRILEKLQNSSQKYFKKLAS